MSPAALRPSQPAREAPSRLTVMQVVPALETGGVERSTLEIGAALVRAGHRSIVVSAGGRLVSALTAAGSEHRTLNLGAKSLLTLRHIWTLRRLLRETRPDIVHARSRLPAWIAWWALRGIGPVRPHFVTTVHGLNSPGRYSAIMTRGERVICVSETVHRYVLKHYRIADADRRLVVIPRGIDPRAFPYGHSPNAAWCAHFAREFPGLRGVPLLVLPGRGTRLKGHRDAVHLLARLRAGHGIEAGLLLLGAREVGRENYVAEIEALATQLGVAQRVAITAPRVDVHDVYAMASVVLQLSQQGETFGRTVIEALAQGVPVAGYAHGGVGELLQELFVPGMVAPLDREALATTVAHLINARPTIAPLTRYRLADMQAATLALYAKLTAASAVQP